MDNLKKISKITTSKQAKEAYGNTPYDSKNREVILAKWNQLSMEEVKAAKTPEQAEKAFNNAYFKSEARTTAFLKWNQLSMEEVNVAETYEQALKAFNNAPDNSKAKTTSIFKLISLCETPQQAKEVYRNAYNDETKTVVLDKWNPLSMEEVNVAETYEQALNAFNNAPEESEAEEAAWVKMEEFTK